MEKLKKGKPKPTAVCIAISVSAAVSPAFASMIKSLFLSVGLDAGIEKVVEQGYSQPVNLEVTDQGITLRVKEVMVDPFRVSLMYGIEKDGKPINPDLLFTDFMSMKPDTAPYINNYVVTDLDGNDLKGVNLPLARTHGDNAILEVGIDDPIQGYFIRSPKDIPDTIVVHFDINLLGETKGKWQLKVPVSLAPAKSATNFIPLNKRYESPFGFKLDFLQLRHGPSKSELLVDIRESQAWRNQYGTLGPQFLYRIKDEQGQVVAAWDGINDMIYSLESKNALLKQSSGGGTTGRMLYRHAFLPFGDAKGLKLELAAVYKQNPVKTPFTVTFLSEELLGHPLEKNYDGKRLTFRVHKKTDEAAEPVPCGNTKAELKGRGFILELDQRLDQRTMALKWETKTDQDSSVFVTAREVAEDVTKETDGSYRHRKLFFFPDEEGGPKQVTMSAASMIERHPVDWSIPNETSYDTSELDKPEPRVYEGTVDTLNPIWVKEAERAARELLQDDTLTLYGVDDVNNWRLHFKDESGIVNITQATGEIIVISRTLPYEEVDTPYKEQAEAAVRKLAPEAGAPFKEVNRQRRYAIEDYEASDIWEFTGDRARVVVDAERGLSDESKENDRIYVGSRLASKRSGRSIRGAGRDSEAASQRID